MKKNNETYWIIDEHGFQVGANAMDAPTATRVILALQTHCDEKFTLLPNESQSD